jgi:hypothetical protein
MTVDEILKEMNDSPGFPTEAVRACLDDPAAVTPRFLDILSRSAGTESVTEEESDALFLIVHVLAELKETRAFPSVIALLSEDEDLVEVEFGDALTETMPGILIALFDGDVAALETLIDARDANEYARGAALVAWTWCALTGAIDPDAARDRLRGWAETLADENDDLIWHEWIMAVAMLGMEDMRDAVAPRLDPSENDIPLMFLEDWDDIVAACRTPEGLAAEMERRDMAPFTDTIGRLSQWAGFSQESRDQARRMDRFNAAMAEMYDDPEIGPRMQTDPAFAEEMQVKAMIDAGLSPDGDPEDEAMGDPLADLDLADLLRPPPSETAHNPYRDVGRNDPCPCGSGKKFKKCCLGKV